jgi:hypothetical protein
MYIDLGAVATEANVSFEEMTLALETASIADGIEVEATTQNLWQRIPWDKIP